MTNSIEKYENLTTKDKQKTISLSKFFKITFLTFASLGLIIIILLPILWPSNLPIIVHEGTKTFEESYREARFAKEFDSDFIIQGSVLSTILWAVQGITHGSHRAIPSAGGTYPLELFISVSTGRVEGISAGFYRYRPSIHSIREFSETRLNYTNIIPEMDERISEACFSILITAVFNRTMSRYGERGIRYVFMELGHAIENANTISSHLELSTALISVNQSTVKDPEIGQITPLILCSIGKMKEKKAYSWEFENVSSPFFNESIELPETNYPSVSIVDAIEKRKSTREYQDTNISMEDLCLLLKLPLTLSRNRTHIFSPMYVIDPSCVRVFVAIQSPPSLIGLFEIDLQNHKLYRLTNESVTRELFEAGLEQPWILKAPVSIILTAKKTTQAIFPNINSQNNSAIQCGLLAQRIMVFAAANNIGIVGVGAFSDYNYCNILGISPDWKPYYILNCGYLIK